MKIPIDHIVRMQAKRNSAFAVELWNHAEREGDFAIIDPQRLGVLLGKHPKVGVDAASRMVELAEPTITELASSFATALGKWASLGFPIAGKASYEARCLACSKCEHWSDDARLGLGKCSAPGCGCTRLKRWLATEKCPLGKWSS